MKRFHLSAFAGSIIFIFTAISPALAQTDSGQKAASKSVDTLTLINGETLTGDLQEATADSVVFNSPVVGKLTVKWANIKELKSTRPFAVLAKDGKFDRHTATSAVPQGLIAVDNDNVQVDTNSGVRTIPRAQTAYLVDAASFEQQIHGSSSFAHGWTGAASAGLSMVRSTQNQTTFTGAINLVRAIPSVAWLPARNRTLVDYNQAYGSISQAAAPTQTALTVKTNIVHFGVERDEYVTERVYYFGGAAFDRNVSQGLALQQLYGAGVGWTAIKDSVQELDVKADIHYEKQHFFNSALSPDQNLIGSTFGETYTRTLPKKVMFDEFAAFTESWNNTNNYSSHVGGNLIFPVYKGLGFHVGVIDDYLNVAPPGFNKNSFQFATGVSYAFSRK
jgi:hypothetical protein